MIKYFHSVFASVFLFMINQIYSEGYEEHRQDVCDCLGYERATFEAKSTFDEIIKYFYQIELDQYPYGAGPRITRVRDGFRKYVPEFTTGNYSHRIVFHNGFKTGSQFYRLSLAMRLQLTKAMRGDGWHQFEPQLLSIFQNEQTAFCKSVECRFRSTYGAIITDEEQRKALIRIIYDIHLLGDYKESANDYTQGCLLDYFELEDDLCEAIRNLGCGRTKSLEYKIKHTSSSDNAQRANHVLKVLKEEMPSLIKKDATLKEALWGKQSGFLQLFGH